MSGSPLPVSPLPGSPLPGSPLPGQTVMTLSCDELVIWLKAHNVKPELCQAFEGTEYNLATEYLHSAILNKQFNLDVYHSEPV